MSAQFIAKARVGDVVAKLRSDRFIEFYHTASSPESVNLSADEIGHVPFDVLHLRAELPATDEGLQVATQEWAEREAAKKPVMYIGDFQVEG